jgi:glucose-1-phosphate thymidylyltransferase
MTNPKAVLMAREPDRRAGHSTPALVSVANRPLLCHALDWLAEGGIREVAIMASDPIAETAWQAVGEGSEWGFDTCWLYEVPGETFGESLAGLARFAGDSPVVLHEANSLIANPFSVVFGDGLAETGGARMLTDAADSLGAEVVNIADGHRTDGRRPAGAALIGDGVLGSLAELVARPGAELVAVANHLTAMGGRVDFREVPRWWRYEETPDALLAGNRFALERLEDRPVEANVSNCVIQGPVSIDPTAELVSSTVRGPAVIGPGARLVSAYVGPFTSIGANAVIEGAEVENSMILPGASIAYLDTRLEGSVIGVGSRVFRDFRLPRAMRLSIGGGAEVAIM